MVAKNSPDCLPAGWTAHYRVRKNGRKVKYFTHSKIGKKFYSKKEVIRYVEMGSNHCGMPQAVYRHMHRHSRNKHTQLVVKPNKFPQWLPDGWIVESKPRKSGPRMGQEYKCYIEPLTGYRFYSKPQVCQYLKNVKRNVDPSKRKKIGTGMRYGSNCHIDHLIGCELHSKPQVSQNLKNIKRNSHTSEQKKISIGMPARDVVIEKVAPDGLPPGWILEIKIKKSAKGIRRDPFYTDPVSGYVFRSRKEVLRYLETGEISRHAFKPKKRGINELESINNEISPPPAVKRQKLTRHATRRQLFAAAGKGSSDMSILTQPETEGSKKRRGKRVSTESTDTKAPTAEVLQEKHLPENETSAPTAEILQEKHFPENVIDKCAETVGNSDLISSVLPKARGSKRKRGKRVFDENRPVSTPASDILQENKLLEYGIGKHSSGKTQIGSIKSKKKKELNLPCRASKRLAGLEPELVIDSGSSERALRVAARKSGESEAIPALGVALAHTQQLEAEPEAELTCIGIEAPLDEEPSNRSKTPLEDEAIPVKQLETLEPEKNDENKPEQHPFFPFGDFWSDPCLEFAFKTLTGAIPVEDNLEYFQQQLDTSPVQRDGGFTLPVFGLPDISRSDVSSHFEAPEKPVSRQPLPVSPSFLPPGNDSLPSCSEIGPQQPSLEGGKNNQREVH